MKKKVKQLLRANNPLALGTPPQAKTSPTSTPVPAIGANGQIVRLEKALHDETAMVRLYEEEDRRKRSKITDLENKLTNLTVQLELMDGKQTRFVRAEQILLDLMNIEKDRTFAEELGIAGASFSLSQIVSYVLAGNTKDAWNAIDVFRANVVAVSARLQDAKQITETKTASPTPQPLAVATKPASTNSVDDELEDRVRAVSRDLYERSLKLPSHINALYDTFVSNRTRFQHLSCERDEILDELIARRIDAQLTPARSAVERSLPLVEVKTLDTLTQLIQFGRTAERRLAEIETDLASMIGTFDAIRTEYHTLSSGAADIRIQAEDAKRMCVLFGLPCPAEIARQFNETVQRLLLVNIDTDQGKRLQNMLAFQPFIKDQMKVIKDFFANLLSAEAFLLGVNKVPSEQLFRDEPSHEEAVKRLFILTADACNDPNSERSRTKTTLASILQKSGLVQEDENALKPVADAQKHLFDVEKVQFYYVWIPKDECRSLAAEFNALLVPKEAVIEALRLGQRKHYDAKYAAKSKAASEEV